MQETINILKTLKAGKKITLQQYRTYKGQVLSGNINGCIKGLQRKGLLSSNEEQE